MTTQQKHLIPRVIIFGAGQIGCRLCLSLQQDGTEDVMFFVDNNPKLWNTGVELNGRKYEVLSPTKIISAEYSKVYISVKMAQTEIYMQCTTELGVPNHKIDCSYLNDFVNDIGQLYLECRNWFLKSYAELVYANDIQGNVAEVGVYRGAFAKVINNSFPDRTLYLYDTFEGFNEHDILQESELSNDVAAIKEWSDLLGNFSNTSEEYVLDEMPAPERCVIKKGYFPDTFTEDNQKFCFVNLDCDLYAPIKAGLEIFYPLMSQGGVILVHEYFDNISFLPGIRAAVDQFVSANNCITLPIGDCQSIAIVKK